MDSCKEAWFQEQGMPEPQAETVDRMLDAFPVRLWYRDTKSDREWWCSRCQAHGVVSKRIGGQRTVTAEEAVLIREKHRGAARCPACGRAGEMLSCNRIRNPRMYAETRNFCMILAKSPEEVWIIERCMYVHPWAFQGYDAQNVYTLAPDAQVQAQDMVRFRLTPGKAEEWSKYWGGRTWYASPEIRDYTRISYRSAEEIARYGDRYGWTDRTGEIIEEFPIADTFLRYSAWAEYRKKAYGHIGCYLANYAVHPSIEMLVKLGYTDIVEQLVVHRKAHTSLIRWDAKSPADAIGLPKDKLRLLTGHEDRIGMIREYKKYARRGERDPWACASLILKYAPSYGRKDRQNLLKGCGSDELELYRYFEKITRENPGCSRCPAPPAERTWKDYIEAAKEVGYDLTSKAVVMPRDLYRRHDDAVALRNAMRPARTYGSETKITEKMKHNFEKRAPELARKYAATGAEYFIRIPQEPEEIIAEGRALSHCVGGFSYIKNHAEGRNPILFLRRVAEPDTPWYTMEISASDGKILQCEGKPSEDGHGKYGHIHRDDLPSDAQEFLAAWEADEMKQIKKEKNKGENAS